LWSNDTFHGTFVERFLRDLKTEQLECSEKGDYLWDFSGFSEKSSRANSVDLGPLNSRNSSSPSTLPVPPSSSSSSSTSPSLPVTTSFSPASVLKSRQSMQRGVNLNETSRVKFVCVINNFRANQISNLEQEKEYDINEKDILVFDGHKVRNSYI
jgi:hypothetical protein